MYFRTLADDAETVLNEGPWHGRLARVHAHWQSLRKDGRLPAYHQLQLASLAPDLRFLATLNVQRPDYQFVRVGEEIAERLGRHLVGSFLADHFTGPAQLDILASHNACVQERLPVLSKLDLDEVDLSDRLPFQRLLLPFAEGDAPVDYILWVMAFTG